MTTSAKVDPGEPSPDYAVLIGNGMSMAFNQELNMANLTEQIVAKFNEAGEVGTDAGHVLAGLVNDLPESDAIGDFEALLGPLDKFGDSLRGFERLAHLAEDASDEVKSALSVAGRFLDDVRRLGVGHVLELIDDMAYASQDNTTVTDFMAAVLEASDGHRITVANLNYDSLVLASWLKLEVDMCDMFMGWGESQFDISGDGMQSTGRAMRTQKEMSDRFVAMRPVLLLHLHGSLGWLRSPDGGVFRFNMEDLRAGFWKAWRERKTSWSPEVVLTNQRSKNEVVLQPPFSLAYDAFYERLVDAGRWLIVGYSFRDECVNDLLARAWDARKDKPKVMVVTLGDQPTDAQVIEALRWSPWEADTDQLLFCCRDGIVEAPASSEWADWTDPVSDYEPPY